MFQYLRAKSMTKNERAKAAIPHQGIRILSCSAWFSSPRGKTDNKEVRREKTQLRRNSHGIVRAIESLRRVRLSLVPRPDSRHCLLPGVRSKTAGLSFSREQEAAWASDAKTAYKSLGGR